MRSSKLKLGLWMSVLVMVLALAGGVSAQTYKNERQVSEDLRRLQSHLNTFRIDLNDMLSRVRYREYQGEDPTKSLQDMETSYRTFNDNFRAKRETEGELTNLLQEAADMNAFLTTISMGDQVNYSWSRVKNVLDQLASQYSVTWSWDGDNYSYSAPVPSQPSQPLPPVYTGGNTNNYNAGLSGKYQLNVSESENARDVAERASMIITQRDRDRIKADLEEKLNAPDEISIDIRGQQIFINSSNGGQAVFVADGVDKYETIDGKNVRVRATLRGERLTISRVGSSDDDYAVTFESTDAGRRMRVSRRVNFSTMSQTVMAESVYDKTSSSIGPVGNSYPNDPVITGGNNTGNNPGPTIGNPRQGEFIVPNGTVLNATLENEINTKISQNNDRFRMTIQSPNEFRGAIIEGYISGVQRSGKINSRARITLNFEKIRLSNGQVHEFAGFLQSFTNANGEIVKVDTEGTAQGDSQTKETVKRGGIGAGIGAVIGAVIGGAKGAIIGATIGAAGGAGSVYVQGRDDLELKPGSTVTVQSNGPRSNDYK